MSVSTELKPIRVMVIDDSKVQLQFAVDLCRAQGWTVADTASDGMEALLKLKTAGVAPFDLMLLDLEMPGLNGIDLLQELARMHLTTPILILSSRELNLLESVSSMGLQSGLNIIHVSQKPLRPAVLQALRISPTEKAAPAPKVSREELLDAIPQLQTIYTPSVSLDTGLIHHMVARLAWQHPQLGLLLPSAYAIDWQAEKEFLRAMAQHQTHVFTQMQHWNACGLSFAVQIELPLHNMQTALHARTLLSEVQEYGIAESKLAFEIQVNTPYDPALASNLSALNLLRIQNIGLALTDHTLDFEWVRHIRKVPFSQLVLSAELLKRRDYDPLAPTLFQHNISLAHDLNMTVHAEGLTTINDWRFLHQQRCNTAQGPLIGPTLCADNVIPWIKENQGVLRNIAEQCHTNL